METFEVISIIALVIIIIQIVSIALGIIRFEYTSMCGHEYNKIPYESYVTAYNHPVGTHDQDVPIERTSMYTKHESLPVESDMSRIFDKHDEAEKLHDIRDLEEHRVEPRVLPGIDD